jgi:hypothetical protein
MSSAQPAIHATTAPRVRLADRLMDAAAALLLLLGIGLFFFARRALDALGTGTYDKPDGVTWVSRADLHAAQSRLAIWVIVVGVLVGIAAAVRHKLRRHA